MPFPLFKIFWISFEIFLKKKQKQNKKLFWKTHQTSKNQSNKKNVQNGSLNPHAWKSHVLLNNWNGSFNALISHLEKVLIMTIFNTSREYFLIENNLLRHHRECLISSIFYSKDSDLVSPIYGIGVKKYNHIIVNQDSEEVQIFQHQCWHFVEASLIIIIRLSSLLFLDWSEYLGTWIHP